MEDAIEIRHYVSRAGKDVFDDWLTRVADARAQAKIAVASRTERTADRLGSCLNLHSRIKDVARDLFVDGHHWDAVFAASKALVNYVKERSGRDDLDGTPLVQTVFSKNNPILVFNDLVDKTDLDEQEGMMHLFEGAVLAIRNPGGHSFPEALSNAQSNILLC